MLKFIGGILVVIAIILIIAFWSQISNFFGWTSPEGDACTTPAGNPGTIQNGICKEVVVPNPVDLNVEERVIYPNYYPIRRAGSTYYYAL